MKRSRRVKNRETDTAGKILQPPKAGLFARMRTYFFTGLIITAPLSISIYITWLFIDWVDNAITPLIPLRYNPETYLPFSLPGLGLVVVFLVVTFIGLVTANIFGRTLIAAGERLVDRMPIVRTIYGALKQIFETVLKNSSDSFRQVVLIEYPRKGIWVLAFVSGDTRGEVVRHVDREMLNVFVPTTPNPTSGFLLFVPEKDCIHMDMSVEDAAKLIISAGVITPPDPMQNVATVKPAAVAEDRQDEADLEEEPPREKAIG